MKIKTYAINLEKRGDRKKHIMEEFEGRELFDFNLFRGIEHEIGAIGLWKSMRKIIKKAEKEGLEKVLICEDDHVFTSHYSDETFRNILFQLKNLKPDIYLGGISGFEDCIIMENNLLWINKFSGAQFLLVFKKFYKDFLSIKLENHEDIDLRLGDFSDKIFCSYPLLSVQKGFGYSDVTLKNENITVLEKYFKNVSTRVDTLKKVNSYFRDFYL